MLLIPPSPFRRRWRAKQSDAPVAPAALTLVSATHGDTDTLYLSFDRAINIDAINLTAIFVNDGPAGVQLVASFAALTDPQSVEIELDTIGRFEGPNVYLLAAADNGIVAADDASVTWPGADSIKLPFP